LARQVICWHRIKNCDMASNTMCLIQWHTDGTKVCLVIFKFDPARLSARAVKYQKNSASLQRPDVIRNATLPIQAINYSPDLWTTSLSFCFIFQRLQYEFRDIIQFLTLQCLRSFTRRTSGYHLRTFRTVQFCLPCSKHGVYHYNPYFLLFWFQLAILSFESTALNDKFPTKHNQ
jgi:hypothetical protein